MSTAELRKRLIDRISKTENQALLEEVNRLLGIESGENEVYKLNEEQSGIVNEAQQQIKKGEFFTDDQANTAADEWLNQ